MQNSVLERIQTGSIKQVDLNGILIRWICIMELNTEKSDDQYFSYFLGSGLILMSLERKSKWMISLCSVSDDDCRC